MALEKPSEFGDRPADLRAAEYVRMSTDMQEYSIQNQSDAIAAFAAKRKFTIVRTYADQGRSGLNIERREALQHLIDDVKNGRADFQFVLVYDVSRWGRFQDADESAYYEFICKEAGIKVIYCAEQFENDGSLASTILKNLKRVMAGEYSRELSAKVFMGQCRMVKMGFWPGGGASYGFRRLLLDERGAARMQMETGQCKFLQTDRTVLVRGPPVETNTIDRIFRSFVFEKKLPGEISAELNADNLRNLRGNRWSAQNIRDLVANERNIGNLIYNRSSFKLQKKLVANPPGMWVRNDGALPVLVDPEIFAKAQEIVAERRRKRTDQEALDRLAALAREKGGLTRAIIAASDAVPSTELYRRRFGSLMEAYKLAGYQPERCRRLASDTKKRFRLVLSATASEIVHKVEELGGTASICGEGVVNINNDVFLTLRIAKAVMEGGVRQMRWRVHTRQRATSALSLLLQMNASNTQIQAFYLMQSEAIDNPGKRAIYFANPAFAVACRYESLETLCCQCVGYEDGVGHGTQDQNGSDHRH